MNWLERARHEIHGIAEQPTANTAEGNVTAVTAVREPGLSPELAGSIGSNGSAVSTRMLESEPLREAFEERAAIMEYDGGKTREDAKTAAWAIVWNRYLLH